MAHPDKNQVLDMAYQIGLKAIVDTVPDPTEWGLTQWKENMMVYFGCAADKLIDKTGAGEEMRSEILASMKEGFKDLVLSQPFVEVPLNPMEAPPRSVELKVIDQVFDEELHIHPHHCTH